jgi:uncharacterized membrane protein
MSQLHLYRDLLEQPSPHAARLPQGDGSVLWANLHLLFWLSLIPFTTAWMGENHYAEPPTALYGFVLLMAAIAYYILQSRIIATKAGTRSSRAPSGSDWKGKLSPVLYVFAILIAFGSHWASKAIYVLVALMWLVPDQRIERALVRAGGLMTKIIPLRR